MKLFEVIFRGSYGKTDGDEDTIYLVRAQYFRAAIEEVQTNASRNNHNGERYPLAHHVYELGIDLCPHAESRPGILRGPYNAVSYNRGWGAWHRKIEGSDYTREWAEEFPIAEQAAPPNGGPAASVDNTGATGGPASVS